MTVNFVVVKQFEKKNDKTGLFFVSFSLFLFSFRWNTNTLRLFSHRSTRLGALAVDTNHKSRGVGLFVWWRHVLPRTDGAAYNRAFVQTWERFIKLKQFWIKKGKTFNTKTTEPSKDIRSSNRLKLVLNEIPNFSIA